MHVRYPVGLHNIARPGIKSFALLFALESMTRALLATVIALQALELLHHTRDVSVLYSAVGIVGLATSLTIPLLVNHIGRRWVYTLGTVALVVAAFAFATATVTGQALGMLIRVFGTACLNITTSLYIMQYIKKRDLTRSEPFRLQVAALAWTLGPSIGVYLYTEFGNAWPFFTSAVSAALLLIAFWFLRLGDDPVITDGKRGSPNPLKNINRFMRQPRLRLAWWITFGRSSWWVFFFIYTPLYMVTAGKGELMGSIIVSAGNAMLLLTPLFGHFARDHGLRKVIVWAFVGCGLATSASGLVAGAPLFVATLLLIGSLACVALDAVGNIPFMRSVRVWERPAMTTVFRTYMDFSELLTPAIFALILTFADLNAAFVIVGLMIASFALFARFLPKSM